MAKITIASLQQKITELEGQKAALSQDLILALGLIPSWKGKGDVHAFLHEATLKAQKEVGGTPKQEVKLPGQDLVPGGRDFGELCSRIGFGLQGLNPEDKQWVAANVEVVHFGRKTVVHAPSPQFLKELAFCAQESGLKSLISDNKKITIW